MNPLYPMNSEAENVGLSLKIWIKLFCVLGDMNISSKTRNKIYDYNNIDYFIRIHIGWWYIDIDEYIVNISKFVTSKINQGTFYCTIFINSVNNPFILISLNDESFEFQSNLYLTKKNIYGRHRFHFKQQKMSRYKEIQKQKSIYECLNYSIHQIIYCECKLKLINKLNHMTVCFESANYCISNVWSNGAMILIVVVFVLLNTKQIRNCSQHRNLNEIW